MTDDERRERYAAAMYEKANPGFRWVDAVAAGLPDCAQWREEADAAMAVADSELDELIHQAGQHISALTHENDDLRAKVSELADELLVAHSATARRIDALRESDRLLEVNRKAAQEATAENTRLRTNGETLTRMLKDAGDEVDRLRADLSAAKADREHIAKAADLHSARLRAELETAKRQRNHHIEQRNEADKGAVACEEENARLRAELDGTRKAIRGFLSITERDAATIARVEAVLKSTTLHGAVLADDVRAALEGESE